MVECRCSGVVGGAERERRRCFMAEPPIIEEDNGGAFPRSHSYSDYCAAIFRLVKDLRA